MNVEKTQWEQCLDAVRALGGKATSQQAWEYLRQFRADLPASSINDNLRMLAVNSPSRTSHIAGREPRRTDVGNRYDQLYMEGGGASATFVFYDPAKHGVWEVYTTEGASSTHGTQIRHLPSGLLTVQSALDYLQARYPHAIKRTDKIVVFQNASGNQLALETAIKSVRLWLESAAANVPEERIKTYSPDRSRNSNLKANAPRLWVGRRAWNVQLLSLPELIAACDSYDDLIPAAASTIPPSMVAPMTEPLNQILYGPPGTGKTFATIEKALAIIEPGFTGSREEKKRKFDDYVAAEQIKFVTFHQSFSYEDFVEGIRAGTNEATHQIEYSVEDGVFKQMCNAARRRLVQSAGKPIDLKGRRIWKLSLGEAGIDESVYEDCIRQGLALIGFGANADYSGVQTRDDIAQRCLQTTTQAATSDYPVTALNTFIRQVKVGDLFVVTQGNLRFRAIGEVTSDYLHISRENDSYSQGRKVNWLRVYETGLPYAELMENRFSQMTIYELRSGSINMDKLAKLLAPAEETEENAPRVLVIDEINRGNVSRIFGELITLIEESKRAGKPEELRATLPYSQDKFTVPGNVYLIGTMNTADRSLAGLDVALRRRFVFEEMPPRPELLGIVSGIDLRQLLTVMNARIEAMLGRDHLLGHAYFMGIQSLDELKGVFRRQIVPLLQEYFFEDWERIALVMNDPRKAKAHQFLSRQAHDEHVLFGKAGVASGSRWQISPEAFEMPESYLGIYSLTEAAQ
jgi:5-methylcytosine-specific restriction protein B